MTYRGKKMIERGLLGVIVFLVVFFVLMVFFNRSGEVGTVNDKQKSDALRAMDQLEQEFYGVSPFWLARYNLTIDTEADLRRDHDGDGLDLLGEYKYLTNPLEKDTDGDGYDDGREVQNGYSPAGEGKLDINKDGLNDVWEEEHGLSLDQKNADGDPDADTLSNMQEFTLGTDPHAADTDGDGKDDALELTQGFDPTVPGSAKPIVEVFINKIGVASPVVLSESFDEAELQKDLEKGLIHYPKMALPGQIGNMMITGHSSNYAWSKGGYNYIFKDLNNVNIGDEIVVTTRYANDRVQEYTYHVRDKFIAAPTDARIFQPAKTAVGTFVTCWPLNSNWKRLVVQADLVEDAPKTAGNLAQNAQ